MRTKSTQLLKGGTRRAMAVLMACVCLLGAGAAVPACASAGIAVQATHSGKAGGGESAQSLSAVASKASELGQTVAMSLIGLALAVGAAVLAFRRDFREAAAVLAIGLVCVLLAQKVGLELLKSTVNTIAK